MVNSSAFEPFRQKLVLDGRAFDTCFKNLFAGRTEYMAYGGLVLYGSNKGKQLKTFIKDYIKAGLEVEVAVKLYRGTEEIEDTFNATVRFKKDYTTTYSYDGIMETTFSFDIIEER